MLVLKSRLVVEVHGLVGCGFGFVIHKLGNDASSKHVLAITHFASSILLFFLIFLAFATLIVLHTFIETLEIFKNVSALSTR